jgi:hypothetical protein
MKKLVIIFVLLTGKLLAQTQPAQPLPFRTVSGTVKNREGDVVSACNVKLTIGDDSLLTVADTAGRFNFENVKNARFSITIISPGYSKRVYFYYGNDRVEHIMLDVSTLSPIQINNTPLSLKNWKAGNIKVGDKIDAAAPDNMFHQALILALTDEKNSFKVHYLDVSYPDGRVAGRLTRPYNLQFKADSAAAALGLRPGKYVMYVYHSDVGRYVGYFLLRDDGTYEYFLDNSKPEMYSQAHLSADGKGEYNFNKTSGIVKWLSGPFLSLDGKAHLSASIDGSAYVIQSMTTEGIGGTYYSNR